MVRQLSLRNERGDAAAAAGSRGYVGELLCFGTGGLGQRLFFLHDGRTSDLLHAINAHSTDCGLLGGLLGGCVQSEAQQVIGRFHALSPSQKQDLLNFLRSL